MSRKVSILLTGSVAAQALPLLAAPALSRLYSPEEFGHFGLFTAAAAILAAVVNLKYDHAVLLARNSAIAFHVFIICLLTTFALAIVFFAAIELAPENLFGSSWLALERSHAVWLPVSFMLAGSTQALTSLAFRTEQFSQVARVRVAQAVTSTGSSLLLGLWIPNGQALITSTILGQLMGVALLLQFGNRKDRSIPGFRWSLMTRCAKKYRRFPMFTTPADLLNGLGANLPMLFIGSVFGLATAGAFALAQRVLGTPLMLIGSAFSDAYRQSATKSFLTEGNYWRISAQTFRTLSLLSIFPASASLMFAPFVVPRVFGSEWTLTGTIVQIMTLAYFSRLIVSPLSYNYYLAKRHSEDFMLQLLSFTALLGIFYATKSIPLTFINCLIAYSLSIFFIYCAYGYRSLLFARISIDGTHPTSDSKDTIK